MRKKWIALALVVVFLFAAVTPALAYKYTVSRPWITSTVVLPTLKAYTKGYIYPQLKTWGGKRLYLRVYQQRVSDGKYVAVGIKGCYFRYNGNSKTYWASTFDLINHGNIRLRAYLETVSAGGVHTLVGASPYRYVHVTATR